MAITQADSVTGVMPSRYALGRSSVRYRSARVLYYLGVLTVGQTIARPFSSGTVSDLLFLAAAAVALVTLVVRGKIEIRLPSGFWLLVGLFVLNGALAAWGSKEPAYSYFELAKYLYLFGIWFWLTALVIRTPRQLTFVVFLWACSAGLSGAGAVAQAIWGNVIPNTDIMGGRMTGLTQHVNDLGTLCALCLVPSLSLLLVGWTRWRRIAAGGVFLLTCIGLILSFSISSALAGIAALVAWVFSGALPARVVTKGIAALAFLGIILIGIVGSVGHVSWGERIDKISAKGASDHSIALRLDTYRDAWTEIKKNPLVGVGPGPNVGRTAVGLVVHNFYLLIWYENGMAALVAIILLHALIARTGVRVYRKSGDPADRILMAALLSSFVGLLVLEMAQPISLNRFAWIPAALILAARAMRINQQRLGTSWIGEPPGRKELGYLETQSS